MAEPDAATRHAVSMQTSLAYREGYAAGLRAAQPYLRHLRECATNGSLGTAASAVSVRLLGDAYRCTCGLDAALAAREKT